MTWWYRANSSFPELATCPAATQRHTEQLETHRPVQTERTVPERPAPDHKIVNVLTKYIASGQGPAKLR